ncbi:MAG: CHAT domain-containing protein [Bacteroidota bacterium]
MNCFKILLFLFCLIFSIHVSGQSWRDYISTAQKLYKDKDISKSIEFYNKALSELKKDSLGTNIYARVCKRLASIHYDSGNYSGAESLFKEAKDIFEALFGKDNSNYIESCMGLGNIYFDIGRYDTAISFFTEAKEIIKDEFGIKDPSYPASCNALGCLYQVRGDFKMAESFFLEAKEVREKYLGKEHIDYSITCNDFGAFYLGLAQYKKAEDMLLEAQGIQERNLGKDNFYYAMTSCNLANLYLTMGQYDKSETLFLESKRIREEILGKSHIDYAASCLGLAYLYMTIEQYQSAELLYIEGVKVIENSVGIYHTRYVDACGLIGTFYLNIGNFDKAESFLLKGKKIVDEVFVGGRDYISIRNNLANLYIAVRKYKSAETLFIEAINEAQRFYGKDHSSFGDICNNFGNLNVLLKKFSTAEHFYIESKRIRLINLGKRNIDYAQSCGNLADLYLSIGKYEDAKSLYKEAKEILRDNFGSDHSAYGIYCSGLGNVYWMQNQPMLADIEYKELFNVYESTLGKVFRFTNEKEKLAFLENVFASNDLLYSFYFSEDVKSYLPYSSALFYRNLLLSSVQELKKAVFLSTDTIVLEKYHKWMELKKDLSFFYSSTSTVDFRENITQLENKADSIEKQLVSLSSKFGDRQQKVSWRDIQGKLKPDEASIEFASFHYYDGKRWTDSLYYVAMILRWNSAFPVMVKLFESVQLESIMNENAGVNSETMLNFIYTNNNSLYRFIWQPIEKHLKGAKKVYFAPTGLLYKVSFAALRVNDKTFLSDKYQLIQLNSTAAIVEYRRDSISISDRVQLYGGISFDVDTILLKNVVSRYGSGKSRINRSPSDDSKRGAGFVFLPGTQKEIENIELMANKNGISVTAYSDIKATEESFKALGDTISPSIIHIATHGFFFPTPKFNRETNFKNKFEVGGKIFKNLSNPLFRSGIVFSGANSAWKGKPVSGIEDGILTAYEASHMYLPSTKLIVLSACETGLGDVQGSEGVFGLQRAFKMAGVPNLIMSLWKVPDIETSEFMTLLYKDLFSNQSFDDSFYNAQRKMKQRYINEPYKWASWILVR